MRVDAAAPRRGLVACGLLLGLCLPRALAAETGPAPATMSDDQFIEWLGSADTSRPVDRRQLAKVLFGIAATLDGDKSSVRLLQTQLGTQDSSNRAVRSLLESRYADYLDSLERLRDDVSALLDEPESLLTFYRVFVGSQRTCWQLDLHNTLVDAYAAAGNDKLAVLSSREACSRLRRLLFQPRVEALLRDALVERVFQQEEIRTLRRDLQDLEQLLADLREIDAAGAAP